MRPLILRTDYCVLYFLLFLVYVSGLWIPLMENDSAQHATMAMRMFLENDYLNIYKGEHPYLDKPHMHFWLAAFSFKIFGISHWAYRLPALLFTLLGAISCFGLAKVLYRRNVGHIAALVFLSSQAIILANHDVRTDAVLTGATIFSLWQLFAYMNSQYLRNIILGAIGAGVAFSCKGQLAIFVIGVCVLTHLAYTRKWYLLFNWKVLVGILCFILSITPVLYAYYVQYDMHPELTIHGQNNISGVKFILWDQSFNRLTGTGFEETNSDYFFFFHTLLWAFLPWSIIAYVAIFYRFNQFFKIKFKYTRGFEIVTTVATILILLVISTSKFKLPHYLNSLLPVFSVLVAGYLSEFRNKKDHPVLKFLYFFQVITLVLALTLVVFINFWSFNMPHVALVIAYLILGLLLFMVLLKDMDRLRKIIVVSVGITALINFCLNTQFYPKLLQYQAGNNAAKVLALENANKEDVFILKGNNSWALSFYIKNQIPYVGIETINDQLKNGQWLFVYEDDFEQLKQNNLKWSKKYELSHYRITKLTKRFLNPNTRDAVLKKAYLLQIKI